MKDQITPEHLAEFKILNLQAHAASQAVEIAKLKLRILYSMTDVDTYNPETGKIVRFSPPSPSVDNDPTGRPATDM